jgi:hypothetical protein
MTTLPIAFKSRRTSRWFVGVGALVLVAGVVAVLVVLLSRNGTEGLSKAPVHITKPVVEKNVPVAKEAQKAVKIFLQTAVPRKNLAAAWPVAGPQIREGMTRAQFLTGNIAVVPMFQPILKATFKTLYSHPRDAAIQVGLIILGAKKKIQVQLYNVTLAKLGSGQAAHWVVNGWLLQQVYTPRASQI